jgi:hypothetical protein
MALTWDIAEVKNYKRTCYDQATKKAIGDDDYFRLKPMTEMMIFITMSIGMNEITEKNYGKFFQRLSEYEEICGPQLKKPDGRCKTGFRSVYTTIDDVRRHIGLWTNASRISPQKWVGTKSRWIKQNVKWRKQAKKRSA